MPHDSYIHHRPRVFARGRKSIRLRGYDYARPGAYFVTFVTKNRENLFGGIVAGEARLNTRGRIVADCIRQITNHYPNVEIDLFVIMPNHIHAIIAIHESVGAGSPRPYGPFAARRRLIQAPRPYGFDSKPTLGHIVAYFKYQTTKRINQSRGTPGAPVWQRNYWEHIIRDERELARIRNYIEQNPARWETDVENDAAMVG
jgi:REP element-mobilizing transposase RayT